MSCLRTRRSDAGEAPTHGLSVLSQALYHWANGLPCVIAFNSLHAGYCFIIFCRLQIIFKINFFENFFQEHYWSVKLFGSRSGLTVSQCQAWSGSKLFAKIISRRQNWSLCQTKKLTLCLQVWSAQTYANRFNPFHSDGLSHIYWYNKYAVVNFIF